MVSHATSSREFRSPIDCITNKRPKTIYHPSKVANVLINDNSNYIVTRFKKEDGLNDRLQITTT